MTVPGRPAVPHRPPHFSLAFTPPPGSPGPPPAPPHRNGPLTQLADHGSAALTPARTLRQPELPTAPGPARCAVIGSRGCARRSRPRRARGTVAGPALRSRRISQGAAHVILSQYRGRPGAGPARARGESSRPSSGRREPAFGGVPASVCGELSDW
ncbi:hypothetical protein P7K49_010312 [Saguinus oedipus]|uniref:Uncharacterized protein n=1 Tax=Saguinus oedipus TaxID=9490 RepID=A0ABQ9VMF3_SAGOE|nr:hypothetical protein P7K49_010312 [Saguinus oedipus]